MNTQPHDNEPDEVSPTTIADLRVRLQYGDTRKDLTLEKELLQLRTKALELMPDLAACYQQGRLRPTPGTLIELYRATRYEPLLEILRTDYWERLEVEDLTSLLEFGVRNAEHQIHEYLDSNSRPDGAPCIGDAVISWKLERAVEALRDYGGQEALSHLSVVARRLAPLVAEERARLQYSPVPEDDGDSATSLESKVASWKRHIPQQQLERSESLLKVVRDARCRLERRLQEGDQAGN